MQSQRRTHFYFVLALLFIVMGTGILLLTTGVMEKPSHLWPLAAFCFSVLYGYAGITKKRYAHALYIGSFLGCSALLKMIAGLLGLKIATYWPIFAIIAGLCLVPAGLMRQKKIRATFLIPSLAFVVLGLFFSVFSFRLISLSFREFLAIWWPALIIIAGLVLLVLWFFTRVRPHDGRGQAETP